MRNKEPQWGCRSCVIVREVWRRGEGWGWEVVGFITYNTKGESDWDCVTYLGCIYMTTYIGIEEMNNWKQFANSKNNIIKYNINNFFLNNILFVNKYRNRYALLGLWILEWTLNHQSFKYFEGRLKSMMSWVKNNILFVNKYRNRHALLGLLF